MEMDNEGIIVGVVCVYFNRVVDCVKYFKVVNRFDISVVLVVIGFFIGQVFFKICLEEIKMVVVDGVKEIDIVINRQFVLEGNWRGVYDEVRMMREVCGEVYMKIILVIGELGFMVNIYKVSMVCMMVGVDFIKIFIGKEGVNVILLVVFVMVRVIREFY